MVELKRAIGLMSGTSMDGIDIALLTTDGENRVERGPSASVSYDSAFRNRLKQGLQDAREISVRTQRPGLLARLERDLTLLHAVAVHDFLHVHGLRPDDIDVIGFHGQTVLHRPLQALTVQIGDGALLAQETGINVVFDMRAQHHSCLPITQPLPAICRRVLGFLLFLSILVAYPISLLSAVQASLLPLIAALAIC